MDLDAFFNTEISEHLKVAEILADAVRTPFLRLAEICRQSLRDGGKILFLGNGGSAADAQHLATEIVVRYKVNRRALPAIALTTDTSILTAAANDFSFDEVFSRQIEALARPGDVVIGISTSGKSPNILRALEAAKAIGAVAAGSGRSRRRGHGRLGRPADRRAIRGNRPHSRNAHSDRPYALRIDRNGICLKAVLAGTDC